jgi:hypothetical protein
MAILQGSSLTNCLYIPDFIASGTVTVFESTSAPTSWTKSTTHNDKSLRIVNGTITTGGSSSFSTVLSASRTLTTPGTDARQTGYQMAPAPTNTTITSVIPPTITVSSNATSGAGHQHTYQYNPNVNRTNSAPQTARQVRTNTTSASGAIGQGQQHTHPVAGVSHGHTLSGQDHNHGISESPHAHGVTFATQPFAVYYRDVILATKD